MDDENRFNVIYHNLSEEDHVLVHKIKHTAGILAALIGNNQNRESAVALTNLETSIMWATKAIFNTKEGVQS